jgi:hypothetical protein
MADAGIDWVALVPELEKEYARIGDLLAFARTKAGMVSSEPNGTGTTARPSVSSLSEAPTEIRQDTFFGMTISEAIKKYLAMARRPQRASDIARALDQGGLLHSSKNWLNTVQSTLTRQKGEVVKLPNGWGLAEWYPGRNFDKRRED